jgi:hypothetical protein
VINDPNSASVVAEVRDAVSELTKKFPLYSVEA